MDYESAVYNQIHSSEIWKKYQKDKIRKSKFNIFYLVSLFSFIVLAIMVVGIFIFSFVMMQGFLSVF